MIIPEGYGEMAFEFSLAGDPEIMTTTCGFSIDSPDFLDPLVYTAAAAAVEAEFVENLIGTGAGMSAYYSYMGATATVTLEDGEPPVIFHVGNVIPGSSEETILPQNNALLIHKRTGGGGRRARGRMYIPSCYVTEAETNHLGVVSPSTVALWNSAFEAWRSELASGSLATLVLLHSESTAPVPSPVPPPSVITQFVCDNVIATQRRRLRP